MKCQKSPAARALEETVAKSQARESARIQHEYFGNKPPTIEERAKKLGLSVVKTSTDWLISDDVKGEILAGFPSRRSVSKWLNGAEAMHMRRAFDATDAKEKCMKKRQRLLEIEAQVRRLELDLRDARERIAVLEKRSIPCVPMPVPQPPITPWNPGVPVWSHPPVTTC